MMQAHEMTFGIEIETSVPQETLRRENMRIGGYHQGIRIPYLPPGWKSEGDSSISTVSHRRGCEVVSPILRGEPGIREVVDVLRILREKSHAVNPSCGVHIHIGFDPAWKAQKLDRLIKIVAYLEKGIYAITGTKRRENGSYCQGIRKHGETRSANFRMRQERRHLLNIRNLETGAKPTVEFRAFSGSLNETKIVGWIQLCLGIVERALHTKRLPKWTPKPPSGGWRKKGEGSAELERLIGYLAWGEGYARTKGGKQYGWVSDIVPQEAVRKEFRRLAKKYDGLS